MDIRKIKKLIELLEGSDISEIEITEGEESVRINRQGQHPNAHYPQPAPAYSMPMPISAPPPQSQDITTTATQAEKTIQGNIIRSPMVGTYYSAASPEAEDFVRIGSQIKVGDTVCIIEAMKMFNRIESDFSGKIVEILVENGQPVEYDEPLFIVE